MTTYTEDQIKHETANFWVLAVGKRGFEVYRTGITRSTRVAQIGHASPQSPNLGLPRAITECDRREAESAAQATIAKAARPAQQLDLLYA